jgi:hypothetical protein
MRQNRKYDDKRSSKEMNVSHIKIKSQNRSSKDVLNEIEEKEVDR